MLVMELIIYTTKFKVFHWSIMSALTYYRVQMEVIKNNTKVAMETIGEVRNLNTKSKMAESRFASSDEIVVKLTN